ncbi:hypothetical protein TK50_05050 [Micromonospora haikouensis]|uniref:Aminotransferase n=2 Tax=Micromonosporaceae TaxID=28056 RepID=A0A0D0VW16_9ACTN|nr:hypothetical protein TK50_05050 [Micromonospora haikouensis]
MLAVDEVNYDLTEQADYVERSGDERPLVNLSSGVNFQQPAWEFVDFVLGAARDPLLWHDYDGPNGHVLGRAAVAAYETRRSAGLTTIGPENVIVTAGASAGIALAARVLAARVRPGLQRPHAVLPAPTFPLVGAALCDAGFTVSQVVSCLPERWLPTVEELTASAPPQTTVIYVNTFNNPTGERYSEAELRQLAVWARDRSVVILHDVVSSDLAPEGHLPHLPSIAAKEGYADGVLTVGSLSKSRALPGFRIAWLIGDAQTMQAAAAANELIAPSSPGLASPALLLDRLAMLEAERQYGSARDGAEQVVDLIEPHFATFPGLRELTSRLIDEAHTSGAMAGLLAWRQDLRQLLAANEAILRTRFGDLTGWVPTWRGDFNTFIHLPALDGRDYLQTTHTLFRRFGLQTLPAPAFGHTAQWWRQRGYFTRLSFALPPAQWVRGLERLADACAALGRPTVGVGHPTATAAPTNGRG